MELKLEHVSYIYNPGTTYESKALDDVCLTIGAGEFIGMIGHTGSGKSTLVQHLNGLLLPSEGKLLADGADITAQEYPLRELRCRVGLVFQYPEYQLFESDVLKDVSFGPKNQKLPEDEVLRRARDAMRSVGLDESYEKRSPFELSGGQKRRAAIAGILAMNPEVLVLDEPTAGMDPEGRGEILRLLKKLHDERHITIVLVSHSMEDVADYADRIVVMDEGKIVWDGEPSEVFVHVRELEEIGLAAPQVSYVMAALCERGWNVDRSVTTIESAADEIAAELKRRRAAGSGAAQVE
ncbi:MAG: energy-coupling factor transporter ATPase [Lachnospiraceae bacterium]|nr:energy-coupling factor transporter ATPase [Lachnospiraceae bacterium]